MPKDKVASFGEQAPMGRAAQPAELAPVYVFLASQESSYITAEILGVTAPGMVSVQLTGIRVLERWVIDIDAGT